MTDTPKADNAQVTVITASNSTDVAFTEKIGSVDQALKDRSAAQKDIKIKWAGVVKVMNKYEMRVPSRRYDAERVGEIVSDLQISEKPDPRLDDVKAVRLAQEVTNMFSRFIDHDYPASSTLIEKKFPAFLKFVNEQKELKDLQYSSNKVDKEATKAAREELQTAVDTYIESIEKYNETLQTVSDVKEYIDVVKNVAEISAIKNGSYTQAK